MSLNVPNLDQITHDNPRLGETLKNVQTFVNNNIATPVKGNRRAAPPKSLANPTFKP
jgi:hypothetical protein